MAEISMFIDTSKCIGCKACQVACKQWHSLPSESDLGKAESSSSTTLTDNDKTWTANQWAGFRVQIIAGTGHGQTRTISSNDATTLTISSAWSVDPDSTSVYSISRGFNGSYTNPPDLSGDTFTVVKFTEFKRRNIINFLFFKEQCRHCVRPKCQPLCPKGVERLRDGFILYNEDCKPENVRYNGTTEEKIAAFIAKCPFNIPRYNKRLNRFVKCDLCYDRFGGYYTTYRDGKPTTACELACPVNAIITGNSVDISKLAKSRFKIVRKNYPYASLYNGSRGNTHVIYLLTEKASSYGL